MPLACEAEPDRPGYRSVAGAAAAADTVDGAVFVDDTGRRARRWGVVAAVISLAMAAFVVVLAASVASPALGPGLHLPGAARAQGQAPAGRWLPGTGSPGTGGRG